MIGELFLCLHGQTPNLFFEPGSLCDMRHHNWTCLPNVSFMSATRDH